MATFERTIRRGLPRTPGGEPWPPAAAVAAEAPSAPAPADVTPADIPPAAAEPEASMPAAAAVAPAASVAATSENALRRGLPRTPGGEAWPAAGFAPVVAGVVSGPSTGLASGATESGLSTSSGSGDAGSGPAPSSGRDAAASGGARRRTGLPRPGAAATPAREAPAATPAREASAATPAPEAAVAAASVSPAAGPRAPLPFPQTVFPSRNAQRWNEERVERRDKAPLAAAQPVRHGPFTSAQWVGAVIVGGLGLLFAAGMLILAVRWFVSLEFMRDFLHTYPGEYDLPQAAPTGIPTWIGWQHFFNVFLMVLIIRSGLQVRHVKRPPAFWSPRRDAKRKISLSLWFHQSLDILWLVNGVIFVVLLFVTGQWMRIVPTSWDVFPNAISAGLQYVSLDWPTENGWVNYNALQQLAYFATVFLAAPLAAVTGVRMSGVWPKNAKGLNKAYPVEWARAVHFPVMLYFCLFILLHVTLVLATGALRNLNHMYGGQDAVNWTGFWIFAASLAVIAAAWAAARPLVLAPIARLFGTVSGR